VRCLVARLDSAGDVLLAGPAVRAIAQAGHRVTMLVSPSGQEAAELLLGVDEILVWTCPWTGFDPPPFDAPDVLTLVDRLRDKRFDLAVVLTSDHQSPLPLALLLRLAGVSRIVASSHDYPGSLLDVRHPPGGPHEVQRNLSLVQAAGIPVHERMARLRVRSDLPPLPVELAGRPDGYVVLHREASVPARSLGPGPAEAMTDALVDAGHTVVVTGVADGGASGGRPEVVDLVGRTGTLAQLAGVLRAAACVVAVNTGPAHLAAAVGTPVVSLFAPVVPAAAWAPWGVPTVVLGDERAACAASRARTCPVPGHPCLSEIAPASVVAAVERLRLRRAA
jgi:lipopolysaccharide heptosyltransferase III